MPDALRAAGRRVVAAWVSTRPNWVEEVDRAVRALDQALRQPEPAPVAWAACENGALRAMGTDAASAELWRRGGYEIVPLVLGAQRPAVPGHVADTLARHGIDAPDALQGSLGVPIV